MACYANMRPIVALPFLFLSLSGFWLPREAKENVTRDHKDEEQQAILASLLPSSNRTVINVTESPPLFFTCQDDNNGNNQFRSVFKDVFPEYVHEDLREVGKKRRGIGLQNKDFRNRYATTKEHDLFQLRDGGMCSDIVEHWIRRSFRGKIIMNTGEQVVGFTDDDEYDKDKLTIPLLRDFTYFLGPVPADYHPNTLRIYYLQFVWYHELYKQGRDELLFHDRKPRNTRKNFLIYSQANCVPFRQTAYDELSKLGNVHHGGRCNGRIESENKTKVETGVTLSNWVDNIKHYSDYRFCLVMEHDASEGYVTEKILMAFQAGCVPIYYGVRSIFDLFNEKAFVFYDIHNETAALEQIAKLESNSSLYDEMMDEPILAHGQETIEDYFSFNDEIGAGKLKQRIRTMLGIDKIDFVK